jgi:hypothetical protein
MKQNQTNRFRMFLRIIIALVWFINGFICKVLNLVPRHTEIVQNILQTQYARSLTISIGISEIIMSIWIISNYKNKLNTITQIIIISIMNVLEFFLVPNLLLWGRFNAFFAFCLILLIYFEAFIINKKRTET